jgi:phenylacetate-CoA ligase
MAVASDREDGMPQNGPEVLAPTPRDPDQQYWDPAIQTMDRDRLRALQDERVRTMIRRIFETPAPLFRRKLEQAGITSPDDVKGVDDLSSIPTTVKQDLRDSEAATPPWGDYRFTSHRDCVRVGQSTGTTGTPTLMLWTRHDIWVEYESAARNWWRNGWRPGMMATHAHPAYLYGGGAMLSGTYEYFGLLNLWVPPPDTDELAEQGIRTWMRLQPDIPFVGFSLGRYFEVSSKLGLDPFKDVGLKIPSLPGAGSSKGMGLMTAGLECYAYLGGPCGQSPGAHLHEDWSVVQAVDPETGRDVPDGEWGNLVVTTLDRDNGVLRYDLEEACALTRDACSCGETTIRGFWGGRFKDLMAVQGKRFQVAEIEGALRSVGEEVTQPSLEYVVVKPRADAAPLAVRVESAATGDRDGLAQRCAAAINAALGINTTVEVLDREALPRSGYKATRVVDE